MIQIQVKGSRTTPGLTLQSLSFQNFSNQILKKNKKFLLKEYISQNVLIHFLGFNELIKLNLDYEDYMVKKRLKWDLTQ